MSQTFSDYMPANIWSWDKANGGEFANINRPIAGPTHEKELPRGTHPFQLYSLATPNGVKVTMMFEELLAAGETRAEYDAWLIKISDGEIHDDFLKLLLELTSCPFRASILPWRPCVNDVK